MSQPCVGAAVEPVCVDSRAIPFGHLHCSPSPSDPPPSLFTGKTSAGLGTGQGRCSGPGCRVMTLGLRRHGWGSETQLDRAIFGVGLAIGAFALGLAIGVLSPALPPAALLAAITIRRHHHPPPLWPPPLWPLSPPPPQHAACGTRPTPSPSVLAPPPSPPTAFPAASPAAVGTCSHHHPVPATPIPPS